MNMTYDLIANIHFFIIFINFYIKQKVVMADAGDYRCRAKNIYGEVTSSTCKTQIRRKFRFELNILDYLSLKSFFLNQ